MIKISDLGLSRSLEVVGQETTQYYYMQHGGVRVCSVFALCECARVSGWVWVWVGVWVWVRVRLPAWLRLCVNT